MKQGGTGRMVRGLLVNIFPWCKGCAWGHQDVIPVAFDVFDREDGVRPNWEDCPRGHFDAASLHRQGLRRGTSCLEAEDGEAHAFGRDIASGGGVEGDAVHHDPVEGREVTVRHNRLPEGAAMGIAEGTGFRGKEREVGEEGICCFLDVDHVDSVVRQKWKRLRHLPYLPTNWGATCGI